MSADSPRPGRCAQETCAAKGKPNRGRASDGRSRAYDDLDSTELREIASDGFHQESERDSLCDEVSRKKAQLCGGNSFGPAVIASRRWVETRRDPELHSLQEKAVRRIDQLNPV